MYPSFDPLKREHRSTTEVERLSNADVLKDEEICLGRVLKSSREDACDADIQRPEVCLSKAERHETKAHFSKNQPRICEDAIPTQKQAREQMSRRGYVSCALSTVRATQPFANFISIHTSLHAVS